MTRDLGDLTPYPDEDTRAVLNDALEVLGVLRDFPALLDDHPRDGDGDYHYDRDCDCDDDYDYDVHGGWIAFRNEPTVRLHLLASLHHQLRADLLSTLLNAYDRGHTTKELAALLDNHPL
jgi:hypothetical protein